MTPLEVKGHVGKLDLPSKSSYALRADDVAICIIVLSKISSNHNLKCLRCVTHHTHAHTHMHTCIHTHTHTHNTHTRMHTHTHNTHTTHTHAHTHTHTHTCTHTPHTHTHTHTHTHSWVRVGEHSDGCRVH